MFFCEIYEFFKNTYFEIQLRTTASESSLKVMQLTLVNYLLNTFKFFIHIFCVVTFMPQFNRKILENLIWKVSKVKPFQFKITNMKYFAFAFNEKVWMLYVTCDSLGKTFHALLL